MCYISIAKVRQTSDEVNSYVTEKYKIGCQFAGVTLSNESIDVSEI